MTIEDDPLRDPNETARRVHQQPGTLATWRSQGKGPKYLKIGRAIFYRDSAIVEWLKAQERNPADKLRAA